MKFRKTGLLSLSLVTALTVSACGNNGNGGNEGAAPSSSAPASGAATTVSEKPFDGQKITIFAVNHPWTDAVKGHIPEFEKATGIKVDFQVFAEEQLQQKLAVQLTTGAETPDAYTYRPYMEKILYAKNGWTTPLDEYVTKNSSYEFQDFSKATIEASTIDGKLMSIPLWTDQFVMYYRKDILEQNNIAVPKTMAEFEDAMKKLHKPSEDFTGFVARGQRNALVTAVSSFVFSEGGDFMTDGKAAVNTPEAVKGFKLYADLVKNYGPKGVLNMNWMQAIALFAQGKAAFYVDSAALYKNTTDPEKSLIADKVGFATLPAGSAGSKPYNIASWSFAMNPKSQHKDAAWAFMEWATNKENVLMIQQSGVPGARDSVWASKEGIEKFPADLAAAIQETMKIGVDHSVPQVMSVTESRDAVGAIVVKAILGEDIQAAAEEANKELQAIIDKDSAK
ncbi:ABC transporter substrate-binding protein [Cohnella cholangitidis]|uniref:Sugar ABC transporter substrate-binding protein n=1 Tax=Cohnella cholangitidis TaxID=2598458 RepID=A0A7G5C3Y3_9BACL|nr:sugar ABC transporter substrate-binding protein [Cohnella cholangitidis]QMV43917.1 sugar ABC transporter substrate-binding protein [Cohnella cholangitidis]